MRRLELLAAVVLALAACSTNTLFGGDGDDDGVGADAGPGVGTGPDEPLPPGDPVYQDQHPRIYIDANRDRLNDALAHGDRAATRFADLVDAEMNGNDHY